MGLTVHQHIEFKCADLRKIEHYKQMSIHAQIRLQGIFKIKYYETSPLPSLTCRSYLFGVDKQAPALAPIVS